MNSHKFLLTIVVSIYGVEQYIYNFLESLKQNNLDHTEIILVNDGTKDNSGNIAKQFASENFPSFQYICKVNGGLSSARNEGLRHAQGMYIIFPDPDDFLETNYVSNIVKAIFDYDYPDLIFFDFNIIECNKIAENKNQHQVFERGFVDRNNFLLEFVKDDKIPNFVWNKAIKISLYKDLQFDETIRVLEDGKLLTKLILNVNKIVYLPEATYNYVIRGSSLTHSMSIKDYAECFKIAQDRYLSIKEVVNNCSCNFPVRFCISVIEQCLLSKENKALYKEQVSFIKKNICLILKDKEIKYSLKKRCVYIYLNVFSIYQRYKSFKN